MTFIVWLIGILLAVGIILLGVFATDEDDDDGSPGVIDEGAAIQQYREWKTQATSYSDMDEINDMIDESRERSRKRNGG